MYGGDARHGGYKRSFEDEDGGDARYGGGYKRSRYDGGGRRDDRYGGGGRRFDGRGGGAPAESERARAWRLAKKAVVELGESAPLSGWLQGQALREHVSRAASRVLDEMDQDPERAKLGHLTAHVLRAATRLAHKTQLLAALAGAVNAKQPDFGRRLADDAVAMLQRAVDAFDTEKADAARASSADASSSADDKTDSTRDLQLRILLLVRFLALLVAVRVVRADDVLGLLDAIQSVCTPDDFNSEADSETPSLRSREHAAAWKDFYAGVVLDALVHSGPALAVNSRDLYESLLSRCKEYISNREEETNPRNIESSHASNWLVRRLRLDLLWEPENEEELSSFCSAFDPLTLYWKALEQLRADESVTSQASASDGMDDGGEETKIPCTETPGVLSLNEIVSSSRWKHVEPHTLTTSLSIDPANFDVSKIPPYAPLFRILTEESGAAGAAIAGLPLASYLMLRDDFTLALETSYPKPAMAAKMLLSMCRNVNARFAAATNPSTVRSEFLLVETLLVKALNETAPATLTYDCAVLTHLVKADARVVSPALAIVVELLFRELPSMRAGGRDAFVLLFSHFLSNFEFKWPWAHWTHVLEAEEDDAQRLFVSAVIERCVRLSYLQHMQTVLPTEFHMLLPPSPQPRIRYRTAKSADGESVVNGDVTSDPTAPASVLCELYEAASEKLKAHPPAAMLQTWVLEEIEQRQISRDDALEVVWTCILEAGAATYTHMRLLLEKYSQADQLRGGDSDELALVRAVASVWLKSPQHIAITLNAMLRHGILRPTTIVQWVFTPDAVQQYSWPYVWGIVDDTLLFVQNEIIVAKAAKKAETADGDKDMDGDDNSAVAQREQELRDMAKILFEGFNRVISAHKSQCDAEGVVYQDNWFASALGRMKSVGRTFRAPLEDVAGALEAETFSSNAADHDARKVFQFVWDSYRSH